LGLVLLLENRTVWKQQDQERLTKIIFQLNERLKREGVKTHKERVEELNRYLSTLSEHHDMYVFAASSFPNFSNLGNLLEQHLTNLFWYYRPKIGPG
jgi:hypothetical protein